MMAEMTSDIIVLLPARSVPDFYNGRRAFENKYIVSAQVLTMPCPFVAPVGCRELPRGHSAQVRDGNTTGEAPPPVNPATDALGRLVGEDGGD